MGVVESVLVLEWLKGSGASVLAGEPVVVIETDKAETELEAPADGELEIEVPAGEDEVAVLTVLGYVTS